MVFQPELLTDLILDISIHEAMFLRHAGPSLQKRWSYGIHQKKSVHVVIKIPTQKEYVFFHKALSRHGPIEANHS